MRGFLALFWITTFMYATISLYREASKDGGGAANFAAVSPQLLLVAYRDYEALLVMLAAIYLYSHVALLYQAAMARNIIVSSSRRALCLVMRHCIQVVPIVMAWYVASWRSWPNIQTGSLLIFAIGMDMKLHSYLAVNEQLDRAAHADAGPSSSDGRRLLYSKAAPLFDGDGAQSTSLSSGEEYHSRQGHRSGGHLVGGDDAVGRRAALSYPHNVSIVNFTEYLWFPTLIYQLSYPRTRTIRWVYVAERSAGILAIFLIFYLIVDQYICPTILTINSLPFVDAVIKLMLPCLTCALVLFFLVFEYCLNWAAEVTQFADRHFYDDWWNSRDMAEFARKWNVPVHKFLQCHIYEECLTTWRLSRISAMFATFFYSAVLHEVVLSSTAGRLKLWLFTMQMCQLPLMWLAHVTTLNRHPYVANSIWWLMIIIGVPILMVLYSRGAVITT